MNGQATFSVRVDAINTKVNISLSPSPPPPRATPSPQGYKVNKLGMENMHVEFSSNRFRELKLFIELFIV